MMRLTTWLQIGAITALLLADLALGAWLSGRTMSESFELAGEMASGLLNLAMTVIAFVFASVLLLVQ